MIEKETIKGLECCTDEWYENCNECPYSIDTVSCERMKLLEDSLDLINHKQELLDAAIAGQETLQKALAEKEKEIEDLKAENQSLRTAVNSYKLHYNEAKAEAYKEFAEKLKNKIKTECNPYGKPTFDYDTSLAIMRYIDNLLKEMVGEEK